MLMRSVLLPHGCSDVWDGSFLSYKLGLHISIPPLAYLTVAVGRVCYAKHHDGTAYGLWEVGNRWACNPCWSAFWQYLRVYRAIAQFQRLDVAVKIPHKGANIFLLTAACKGSLKLFSVWPLKICKKDFLKNNFNSASIRHHEKDLLSNSSTACGLISWRSVHAEGGIHIFMTIYNWREYIRGDHRVDATDIFQKAKFQKNLRMGKLIFYLLSFVLLIYKWVPACCYKPICCSPQYDIVSKICQE